MKQLGLIVCCLSLLIMAQAQSLDQMTVATGSITDARMSVTIGEPCLFAVSHENGTLSGGAQGGTAIVSTSVQQFTSSSRMQVFPNPVTDKLFVQVDDSELVEGLFKVYDSAGKLLLECRQTAANGLFQLDVSQLPSGGYILNVYLVNEHLVGNLFFVKSR